MTPKVLNENNVHDSVSEHDADHIPTDVEMAKAWGGYPADYADHDDDREHDRGR
jgi:hypothetical protein